MTHRATFRAVNRPEGRACIELIGVGEGFCAPLRRMAGLRACPALRILP
ncbi:hypothetical protein [Candidatus Roseilinea sp. NK_OTU-006]|nr:hypothetical protein [Candidatus Roseilinea sp. NK_OTU-006]